MPRDGSGIYTQPSPDVVEGTVIESAVYNVFTHDVETEMNQARPIIAGGTGATNAPQALANLGGETAAQVVTNYDSHLWYPGSFRSAAGATGAPVDGHAFAGVCYIGEALAYPPTNQNVIVEARDLDDHEEVDEDIHPGTVYVRQKKAGIWLNEGVWEINGAAELDAKVDVAGDVMTGNLSIAKDGPLLILNKEESGQTQAIVGQTGGLNRWGLFLGNGTAEVPDTNTSAGSDFTLSSYDDLGALVRDAVHISRASGLMSVQGPPTADFGVATKKYVDDRTLAAGSTTIWLQATAPVGWTKIVVWNDCAIRVVNSTTGGDFRGGSNFSYIFGQTATQGTTLSQSTLAVAPVGILTSSGPAGGAVAGVNPWGKDGGWVDQDYYVTAANNVEGLRVGGAAHSHTMDMRVTHVDAIPCYRNAY